jgi:peroxiredoxin
LFALLAAPPTPWLGVELNDKAGKVQVVGVFAGSPAAAAGMKVGDVIVKAAGAGLTRSRELIDAVGHAGVGHPIALHVLRAQGETDLHIQLVARPELVEMQRSKLMGKPAPDFPLKRATGIFADTLSSLKGKVVVLDFWATWCGPCMRALPHMQALHTHYLDKGLRVVGVTSDDWQHAQDVVKKMGLTYGMVSDEQEQISADYLVTALPTLVLIDRAGNVNQISIGDLAAVDKAVADLLK